VYEYFLSQFASAEGKKGGQFYTPASVVRLLVEMLAPYKGRVYDPCCGSGGMFVQSARFIEAHANGNGGKGGRPSAPTPSAPTLPPHLAALFPSRLVESELGEVPEGWEVCAIGDLAEVVGGSTPSTKEPRYWERGMYHWATPKDLSSLTFPVLLETERKITEDGLRQISSGLLPMGTVLLSSRAPIGYLAIAEIPIAINQGFIALRPAPGISNLFLLLWIETSHDEIVSRANGSTFLEISKSNFRLIPVIQPPETVMRAFDEEMRLLYERMVLNERASRTLAALRDALLPRLVSGELRVKDVEPFIAG
jgi:type I restriction enzyme S subunit